MSSGKTPERTITGKRLRELQEKEGKLAELQRQYDMELEFVKLIRTGMSEKQIRQLSSGGSCARRDRQAGGTPLMEDEMRSVEVVVENIRRQMSQVKAEIEQLRSLS
ncbi:hypothetical protein GP486_007898 [Trichoglossum hirsutum]|uniref:Uncharacterized protein n=1 Tax=Trichoglossum hirsutum TaxID=265104 RepID=A0A9P8I5I8_9PEZI|nr:hypothetical protein GP486_007898 [Trichoglossum hirsutum]